VSWNGVQTFIRKLNALTGEQYRLPTEAEWEYAARSGGRNQTYAGGENLDDLGWHTANSEGRSHPVGQKKPNGLGLYDMSGNVWEWVADDWHGYHKGAPEDGRAWVDTPRGAYRVIRGGGWDDTAWYCRSTTRYSFPPRVRHDYLGFRLARSVALGP
jgi:formylglycine-generating enzyme required for sulfatase activity